MLAFVVPCSTHNLKRCKMYHILHRFVGKSLGCRAQSPWCAWVVCYMLVGVSFTRDKLRQGFHQSGSNNFPDFSLTFLWPQGNIVTNHTWWILWLQYNFIKIGKNPYQTKWQIKTWNSMTFQWLWGTINNFPDLFKTSLTFPSPRKNYVFPHHGNPVRFRFRMSKMHL